MAIYKNIIGDIYGSKGIKKGLIKKESELTDEFEKFSEQKLLAGQAAGAGYNSGSYPFIYQKQNLEILHTSQKSLKLAAATESGQDGGTKKDYFYINEDLNSALRLKIKKNREVTASLISSPHLEFKNPLVFCRETDKYYLPDAKDRFLLGTFDAFNPENFHFEIILPVIKVDLVDTDGKYTPFHSHDGFEITEIKKKDGDLVVKISKNVPHNAAVILSGAFRDFAPFSGSTINISKAILSDKMTLLFY